MLISKIALEEKMINYITSLEECVLFKNVKRDSILNSINLVDFIIRDYKAEDIIALEDDDCNSIGIILEGNIEIHKSYSTGKIVIISHFKEGNIFGEALVFSGKHKYPANIISIDNSKIMFLDRDVIIKLMTINEHILNNFVSILSNRILMLNDRLTNLSLDTLRKKITNVLLLEYGRQKSQYITLPYSRKKMAELLNTPRPSLSRELVKMKEDNLIDFYKNKIKIINLKELEKVLL